MGLFLPWLAAAQPVLNPETSRRYVEDFNRKDRETVTNHIPNAAVWSWMATNVPTFECPDKDLEETYYFRWWTYRKHIKQTPDGFVVTEFLPKVSWSKKHNTINCPAGHHLYEGRWIRDPRYLDDYTRFYFGKGGDPGGRTKVYSQWLADAICARCLVNADRTFVTGLLADLVENHEAWSRDGAPGDPWQKSRRLDDGLYWQIDSWEGGEVSIGGTGVRPMINSYRYGDALAIAHMAELAGRRELTARFRAEAQQLRTRFQEQLWDPDAKFFKVLRHEKVPTNQYHNPAAENCAPGQRVRVREIFGYVPWYFNLPEAGRGYEEAWRQLTDPRGFLAPHGPTVAERRHPNFKINQAGCEWRGASWPFATAQTLTALANLLNNDNQDVIGKKEYFGLLTTYARSHRRKLPDGTVVAWIDESLNPDTGAWIPTEGDPPRGKDYNHSTFCDLVISGLIGLRPRADDIIEVNPLVPAGAWDYFCLDQARYHGRNLTILYDKTGERYGRGKGLQVLVNGQRIAGSESLQRVTAQLPKDLGSAPKAADHSPWVFACQPDNDLYQVVEAALGRSPPRFDAPTAAVAHAPPGAGVLLLADGYPQRTTAIEPAVFEAAAAKSLRLYIEYPASLPNLPVGAPQPAGIRRGVITSDWFGPELRPLRIVALNGCQFVPVQATNALLVLAKVAGVDTAVFGLKDTLMDPILFEHSPGLVLAATTRLSQFVTGRYLPSEAWRTIWETILCWLQPHATPPTLHWTPTVRPTFSRDETLPPDAESQALRRAADWIVRSRILRHPGWPDEALKQSLAYNTVRDPPLAAWPVGDGSLGLLEGYSSTIRADGSQPMRYAVRNDCLCETAMLLAFDSLSPGRQTNAQTASHLVEYLFQKSGLAGGPRADPNEPSYGLIGWALDSPGAYWGDDNARALLGLAAASVALKDPRWDEALGRCLLANFRTTGRTGFREACVREQSLHTKGWEAYWKASPVQYSPHFQSWLWACFFWAYEQTGFEPLRTRSLKGLRQMMAAYPQRWEWVNRSGTIERARALLPLAWLVRIEDTPEHRRWLRRVAEDLIACQDASGAIRETIGDGGHGIASNAAYGTGETSLIQTNGDPVCDLLYACNFALIGLHEAAAATGDPLYQQAEDRLARFLCRIQIRSEAHPELDGAWYRAFDFRRWEYWASNSDWEWGPWCIESGWTQPWIAGTLALRQRKLSLWELIRGSRMHEHFSRLRPQMLPDEALTAVLGPTVHAARGKTVEMATDFAPQYAGGGVEGLTDGELATTDFHDSAWQGYHGVDLEATIDLKTPQPIRQVSVRFLQDVSVGIFLPTFVDVALSSDGRNFEPPVTLKPDVSEREAGPLIKTLAAELDPRPARFIRVQARNLGLIPDWHTARREKAWLFVDEILVNPSASPGPSEIPGPARSGVKGGRP